MTKRKKVKKNKLLTIIIFLILIGGITLGVKNYLLAKTPIEDTTKEDNPNPTPSKKPDTPKVKIVDTTSKSRPYAVMINNLGEARPYHIGLQDAYLVYEIVVEGGITRYLALFKDNLPETIGSVRSARHYYLDYVMENDAYYVHWGWSPQAESDINSLKINNLNGLTSTKPYFFRKNLNIGTEHTGYANLSEMSNLVTKKKYRADTNKALLLKYSATNIELDSNEDVKTATKVDLKYSNNYVTNYVYDSEKNVYKQLVNNKEHKDYATKEQYTAKNIITYQVGNTTINGDSKGRQDLKNIGNGKGYYLTNGKVVPITWEKSSRSDQTVYKYLDGTKITVNDGNTWIHIVPEDGNISIS